MGNEYFIVGSNPIAKSIRSVLRKAKLPYEKIGISAVDQILNNDRFPRMLIYCDEDMDTLHDKVILRLLAVGKDLPILIFADDELPSEILNKPGSLTQLEYDIAQFHSYIGFKVISKIRVMEDAARIVHQHHERIDGSGYPLGLKGSEIDMGARILAVADVLEAMTSSQPYRFSHDLKNTLEEILKGRGTSYDPVVVDACIELFKRKLFEENVSDLQT